MQKTQYWNAASSKIHEAGAVYIWWTDLKVDGSSETVRCALYSVDSMLISHAQRSAPLVSRRLTDHGQTDSPLPVGTV